ncbi:S-methyl-5-thioribose kinase [Halalkalibacter urbisdiaboli]|uniref:S-methyl-5-thioribose kinase n=1 Tax=Halalkalibacter urbisdiaboli TaxID=1960589 RepID=UPI000B444173|nr:S-methyl-5-thioribose kinase [Halalkalibacter urbisdiaboli]
MQAREYEELTLEKAAAYLIELGLFSSKSILETKEIGDGNLNYVFHVKDRESGQSYVIKQALPYAKVVGESWPLTLDRARIEAEALKQAGEFVPHLVPKVFHNDQEMAITVMEDLSDFMILRKALIDGNTYPNLAKDIGTFLAHTLFKTSTFGYNQQAAKQLAVLYSNPELCKITEDLVFTDPYFDHDTNNFSEALQPTAEVLWSDNELKREVAKLKHAFLTKSEALIHGDLHTGSIFITKEKTKVIDPEFAFYGPFGFDVGAFIANILLNFVAQAGHIEDENELTTFRSYLLSVIEETWTVFESEFKILWENESVEVFHKVPNYVDDVLATIWEDALGFAGCKMIRRIIGLAHVADIDSIVSDSARLSAQQTAIKMGRALIVKRTKLKTLNDLLNIVKEV